jgi:hypothetical protein
LIVGNQQLLRQKKDRPSNQVNLYLRCLSHAFFEKPDLPPFWHQQLGWHQLRAFEMLERRQLHLGWSHLHDFGAIF